MHKISSIHVKNYKSIIDAKFPLSPYTPLVGYNNAGKTNILNALQWLVKKSKLSSSEFYDTNSPVEITGEITGIDEEVLETLGPIHRQKIAPFLNEGNLKIRRSQSLPEKKDTLQILQHENGDDIWKTIPTGIDAAISNLFPDPIFIGAMENATEDVGKFATGTTIGKLIKEIIAPVKATHAAPVTQALADIAKKLSADGEEKDQTLVDLDQKIQNELNSLFPGVSAKVHIPTPNFDDFIKNATIKVFEGTDEGRDASSFGHGAQRSVQVALIKCLSKIKAEIKGTENRTTLLLIDEPELYLHPQAIDSMQSALNRLSGEGYQVVFSTHSANMIGRKDAPNSLLIRRQEEAGTMAYPRIKDAVQSAIDDAQQQADLLFSLSNSTKVLFSEKIILVEGKTERTILPEVFYHRILSSLGEKKIGLVPVDGSGSIRNTMNILDAMKIPRKAIVDLDFAFRISGFLEDTDQNIEACKLLFADYAAQGTVSLEGDLPTKHYGIPAAKAYEKLASDPAANLHIESIHNKLRALGIWCWKKGTIESHLGLASKKASEHARFIGKLDDRTYLDGLPDYAGVEDMLDWLAE